MKLENIRPSERSKSQKTTYYELIYMKCPGQENLYRQERVVVPKTSPFGDEGGKEMRVTINGYGVFFRGSSGDEKVIVVMVEQFCEHIKNH